MGRICEFQEELAPARIEVNGSTENARFSTKNAYKLGPHVAEKIGSEIGRI